MLLLLLWYPGQLSIPAWLQLGGRLHPLLLHFPIALIAILVGFTLWRALRKKTTDPGYDQWLSLAAALTSLTALSGILLSNETSYEVEALNWHRWSGAALSIAMLLWVLWPKRLGKPWMHGVAATLVLGLLVVAGHEGASITHGTDFLLQPLEKAPKISAVNPEDALVFEDMVKPILQEKCMGCHHEGKAKGQLIMSTEATLLKGGKSGKLWDLQVPGFGLLMDRIHLPANDKKHMPPTGKPQLSAAEMVILERWIAKGADFKLAVSSLPASDTLSLMAQSQWSAFQEQAYAFEAAPAEKVKALNTANRSVYPVAANSPALEVVFFGPSLFRSNQLKELETIKQQVTSINLNKMPVQDEDLKLLANFAQLERLNLAFTGVKGDGLKALAPLKELQQLSLSGTAVKSQHLNALKSLSSLQRLYLWNTGIPISERPVVEAQFKPIKLYWGFRGDTIRMQLNAPILENTEQVLAQPITLKLRHYLPGVDIRYTLDGTEPDSIQSPSFTPNITIDKAVTMKARAFKKGWISSEITSRSFLKKIYIPDSIKALTEPDDYYKKFGARILNDDVKGGTNFRNGEWLGFRDRNLDMVLYFRQATAISAVTVSSLVDIGSYIMPPLALEVWGGPDEQHLRRLTVFQPKQPGMNAPAYLEAHTLRFSRQSVQCIRVIAKTVRSLPAWHPGKGDKGWVFVDEFFVE